MSRPHSGVSEDGTRLPDAPTCPDGSGRVYGEPQPPQELHSPYCTVRVPGSGAARNSVSTPLSTCVDINGYKCSLLHHLLWVHLYLTGNTSAVMSTESCHCWPTWASFSLLTLDQLDLYTASHHTRFMTFMMLQLYSWWDSQFLIINLGKLWPECKLVWITRCGIRIILIINYI